MRRRLFNLLGAVSLVLCVGTGVVWIRSEFHFDCWFEQYGSAAARRVDDTSIMTDDGQIVLIHDHATLAVDIIKPWRHVPTFSYTNHPGPHHTLPDLPFFRYSRHPWFSNVGTRTEFAVRLWIIVALTALLPLWKASLSFQRRVPPGLCPSCGYDLRATPERCPECGASPVVE